MLIEPCWRLIVLESSLYGYRVIFNQEIEYTDEEEITMEEENHQYERGYESDDEDDNKRIQEDKKGNQKDSFDTVLEYNTKFKKEKST